MSFVRRGWWIGSVLVGGLVVGCTTTTGHDVGTPEPALPPGPPQLCEAAPPVPVTPPPPRPSAKPHPQKQPPAPQV
jgi:hypothetical protein